MKPVTIISADSHYGNTMEGYRPYLDPKYRDLVDELIATEAATYRTGIEQHRSHLQSEADVVGDRGRSSPDHVRSLYLDLDKRMAELDAEGIAAEITMMGALDVGPTPFFAEFNRPYPAEVRAAGARAHNRWLVDLAAQAPDRLILFGESSPCLDMAQSVQDLKWLADHGFRAIHLPGVVADPNLPPLASKHFEPFWSACEDLGLVLYIHAGWGEPQGKIIDLIERMISGELITETMMSGDDPNSPFALHLTQRRPIWQLMLGGVFDRHPNLKVGLVELRSDWIPGMLAYLDQRFAAEASHLALKPSEYWHRNCYVTPSAPRRAEIEQRHEVGVDNLLFGTDFPHIEGTWPNTKAWIQAAFAGILEDDGRKILGENAIRLFKLDADKLDKIAAKIGPSPDELFGGNPVHEPLMAAFDRRGKIRHPVEDIATSKIEKLLAQDLAATGAT